MNKIWEDKIYYSQCWEDADILTRALQICPEDSVISVTSGGDNTLALLLNNPRKIAAIDINRAQNYLLALKIAAIRSLNYGDFLEFLGVVFSKRRMFLYEKASQQLSKEARLWFDERKEMLAGGIINAGKLEKYFGIFRKFILPLIHGSGTVRKMFDCKTSEEQKKFYDEVWDTWRWRFVFKIFFSRFTMSRLGRNAKLFGYMDIKDIGNHYFVKTKKALTERPARDNYYLQYILLGQCINNDSLPPYLLPENFMFLKQNVDKIEIVNGDLAAYLRSLPDKSVSGLNLSDIFESKTVSETDEIFKEIIRVGRQGARIVYWNNLVKREFPEELSRFFEHDRAENILEKEDKVFFYSKFHADKTR